MKYRIEREAVIVGQYTIAAGTVIDTDDETTLPSRLMRDLTPPLNALALDYEALDAMRRTYGPNVQLFAAAGLDEKTAKEIGVPIRALRAQQAEQRKLEAALATLAEVEARIEAKRAELAGVERQIAELKKVQSQVIAQMEQTAAKLAGHQ
jgi:hypothetical protein